MKILLVSDSHGYDDELKKVLENVKCDLKIHCGDPFNYNIANSIGKYINYTWP